MNAIKTFLLLFALTALFVLVGQRLAGNDGMIIALIFAAAINFFAWWFSDKLILAVTGAKPAADGDLQNVRRILSGLAISNNMPLPKLYVMETQMPNAFATGRNPSNAAVAVTRGIVSLLSDEELKGVMAHELAHIRNRDTLISTVAATVAGAIFMLARMAQWAMIFGGRGGGRNTRRGGGEMLIMAIFAPLAAMLIQMAISRSREFSADKSGAALSGDPMALASALRKLAAGIRLNSVEPSPVTNHLYIVHPFGGKSAFALFSTHPPVEERIRRLEAMASKAAEAKYSVPKIIH
ncbi:MAG: protease HtpX [Elusimicrobia bacterium HGW-Elusimicrobia-1]|jgi:heat shock protein HtpX|nr:MAG: protease HtpX [Elusimicrobia bacterium HGW-Elusimicrobia-1]